MVGGEEGGEGVLAVDVKRAKTLQNFGFYFLVFLQPVVSICRSVSAAQ
jgi:hypothetical protein